MEKTYLTTNKINGKWDCSSFSLEGDFSCRGLTWPPKCYTCSFCKRDFRSAQALGGHMNVHRKDRARLRLLSSLVLDCQIPEPNSNPNPSSSPSNLIPSPSALNHSLYPHQSPLLISSPSSSLLPCGENRRNPIIPQQEELSKQNKTMPPFLGVEKLNRNAREYELEVGEAAGLDMEIGFKDSKDVLDLELRLGYF